MKNKILGISLVLLIAVCVVIVLESDEITVYSGTASWNKKYQNITDIALDETVDVIIYGNVVLSSPYKRYTNSGRNYIISTRHEVKTIDVIKGESSLDYEVHQTGGQLGKEAFSIIEDPLMKPGDNVVLFLHEYEKGEYYIVGGPQGRFVESDGKIYGLSEVTESSEVDHMTSHLKTSGISLDEFKNRIGK